MSAGKFNHVKSKEKVQRMFEFFARLDRNNNRVWFQEHKPEYQALRAEWIAGIARTIAALSQDWPEVACLDPARATYRVYRDIRFSADKTPYKTFLSSTVTPPALLRGSHTGIYVQAGHNQADTGIYGGIWCPDAPALRKIRAAIDANAEEWLEIVNDPALTAVYGTGWCGQALKTAPKGYDRDHPLVEYLRLKDIGKFTRLPRSFFADAAWPEALADRMRPLLPLMRFLIYTLFEEE